MFSPSKKLVCISLLHLFYTHTLCSTLANLPGTYNVIDLDSMLRIKTGENVTASCPSQIIISSPLSNFPVNTHNVTLRNSTTSQCAKAEAMSLTFTRITVSTPVPSGSTTNVSLSELTARFPIFRAVSFIREAAPICPLLNRSLDVTQVLAQDVGYYHSVFRHYGLSKQPIGAPFNTTFAGSVAAVVGNYTLALAVDANAGSGCTYMKGIDANRLMEVIKVANGTGDDMNMDDEKETNDEPGCFPATTRVRLSTGAYVNVRDLRVGERVYDSATSSSTVILHSHGDDRAMGRFIRLRAGNVTFTSTAGHYLLVNSQWRAAKDVRCGDVIRIVAGEREGEEKVVSIEHVKGRGLYNPHTKSGEIVVYQDGEVGVVASCYTEAIQSVVAHALICPIRSIHTLFGILLPSLSALFRTGGPKYLRKVVGI